MRHFTKSNLSSLTKPAGETPAKSLSKSALTSLEAWVQLVDDVYTALTKNQAVFAVTSLKRFERVLDLHVTGPQFSGYFYRA
jgi:hypothetical protein